VSYKDLRRSLCEMPPAGRDGFEGLIATLLTSLTGDKFYVARSGDQPADAVSAAGRIAIQAKRYDKTPLDETQFEGDFSKAVRLCRNLDCYVLAASRTTAQLNSLADEVQSGTGVDIVLLGFNEPESELSALCVTYWEQIKGFPKLKDLAPSSSEWAKAEASRDEISDTVRRLRETLTQSIPLAAVVERKLKSYLHERFGISHPTRPRSQFRINLPVAVPRRSPQQQLNEWWKQGRESVVVLRGEEGMGKSWTASAFCGELLRNSSALVLWLDSADWVNLRNLDGVLENGLMMAGFNDVRLRRRLTTKAKRCWTDKLLVVLDGVNEREARRTARQLLAEYHASEGPPFRFLFTTRPIKWTTDEHDLWMQATFVDVEPFTESASEKSESWELGLT